MGFISSQDHIHRGHREARRALEHWLAYTRLRNNEVVKNWQACENLEPERLPISEQIKRGEYGDNVIPLGVERPSLDVIDQLPLQSFTISLDNDDVKAIIKKINQAVRAYFYVPATALTYIDFCQLLEAIKSDEEAAVAAFDTASIYQRDHQLLDCHYSFIHAGMGKLRGDVETGISQESAESLEMAVAMLANLCASATTAHVHKLQHAHTAAQNLQMMLTGNPHLPTPKR